MINFPIYYQNVCGLRTAAELFSSLVDGGFKIVALTETWLGEDHIDSEFFPASFNVFRADRDYSSGPRKRGGGILIAVSSEVKCSRRVDLELTDEVVWVEIESPGRKNLLISNHYFSKFAWPAVLREYFEALLPLINQLPFDFIMLGDFNALNINWPDRSFSPDCNFYAKLGAKHIFEFVDLACLDLLTYAVDDGDNGSSVLDLVFTNSCVEIEFAVIRPDSFHPPLIIQVSNLDFIHVTVNISFMDFRRGNYINLYHQIAEAPWSNGLLNPNVNEAAT